MHWAFGKVYVGCILFYYDSSEFFLLIFTVLKIIFNEYMIAVLRVFMMITFT